MSESAEGSASYRAPEAIKNQEYNNEADIWSMGCILYELAVGKALFADDYSVLKLSLEGGEIDLALKEGFSDRCKETIRESIAQMLQKDVSLRLSAAELFDHFTKYIELVTQSAPQPFTGPRIPPVFELDHIETTGRNPRGEQESTTISSTELLHLNLSTDTIATSAESSSQPFSSFDLLAISEDLDFSSPLNSTMLPGENPAFDVEKSITHSSDSNIRGAELAVDDTKNSFNTIERTLSVISDENSNALTRRIQLPSPSKLPSNESIALSIQEQRHEQIPSPPLRKLSKRPLPRQVELPLPEQTSRPEPGNRVHLEEKSDRIRL